jgi:hypothetical protein
MDPLKLISTLETIRDMSAGPVSPLLQAFTIAQIHTLACCAVRDAHADLDREGDEGEGVDYAPL